MRKIFVIVLMALSGAAFAQAPQFSPVQGMTNYLLPGLVYVEEDLLSGEQVLKEAFPFIGVWMQFEVTRAPYMDAVYAGKGGSIMAVGDGPDECYLYGINFVNGRIVQIGADPVPNPWLGKREHEWVRMEQHMGSIVFAVEPPEQSYIVVHKYSFALHEVESKEIPKHLFGGAFEDDLHMKLAPDAQHIAFVTRPKPVDGMKDTYVSTLKVIHFSNMTTTDATSAIYTRTTGGPDEAWPAFDFQSPSHVHYLSVDIEQPLTGDRSKWLYKSVEIEGGVNSEIFAATLPAPARACTLNRERYQYLMLYTHETDPPVNYLADHDSSRSMLLFPHTEPVSVRRGDSGLEILADGKIIYGTNDLNFVLDESMKSYFEHRVFTLRHQDRDETQVWFYDSLNKLWPAVWTENPVRLIGVMESVDWLRKKI